MEWTDWNSTDWKNKINSHDTRDLKIGIMKKINPNDEVNAKILQILDERENDIAAANKALEELYNEQIEESWDVVLEFYETKSEKGN